MTELRAVRANIVGLGRALQDPIDQQILWHLLSTARGGSPGITRLIEGARQDARGPGDAAACWLIESHATDEYVVTPSLTAAVTRRPRPEIRVHYRNLHEQGLVEQGRRIAHRGWLEHTYALAPRLRPVLEAISALALPEPPAAQAKPTDEDARG